MAYEYPANDFDRSKKLLSLLGSFWSRLYEGVDVVESVLSARAQQEAQAHLDLLELVQCTSRYDVPLFHREHWHLLTLRESQRNAVDVSILRFGDEAVFGHQPDGTLYYFGQPINAATSAFALPDRLADCSYIFNRITEPSRSLVLGVDFTIDQDRKAIVFRENPFNDGRIPQRNVLDGEGNVIDREVGLWVFRGGFDYQYAYRHFGYLLGLQLRSTPAYRQLLNAILDAAVSGTSLAELQGALCAFTGVPLVVEPRETVELVTQDSRHTLIATDKNVYRFAKSATPLVAVGQQVQAGDPLVTAVTLYEFGTGQVPDAVRALTIGKNFTSQTFYGDFTFRNAEVPLVVEENVHGRTKVSFEIGGWPNDVKQFWDGLHAAGIAAGQTLANLLDVRANPASEPTAASLPATINPLEFLVANVLRNNAYLAVIKASDLLGDGLGLEHARWLRKIVPPHTFLFLLVELVADGETLTMDGPGDENGPGYSEAPDTLIGMEPIAETVSHTSISENPTISLVSDHCQ